MISGTARMNLTLGVRERRDPSQGNATARGRQNMALLTDARRNAQAVRRKPDARFAGGAIASLESNDCLFMDEV